MLVHLQGDPALLARRMGDRQGHYMPAALLQSQLAILEPPAADEQVYTADIAAPPERLVAQLLPRLHRAQVRSTLADAAMPFTQVTLYTAEDGRARFRDDAVALTEGKPAARLSPLLPATALQLRMSPVGFASDFHCTENPQWLFVLGGQMEIGLQDGSTRVFGPGDHFYSADTLPPGTSFDARLHGHCSRQIGEQPLVTAFVRAAPGSA